MIIGTGIDLIDVKRVEKLILRQGDRFIEKYFTETEAEIALSIEDLSKRALHLAKRFAAKEACAKALGTGFRDGIYLKDMTVSNDALGCPHIALNDGALARLAEITPEGHKPHIFLSLTDEPPYAQAQVIIEANSV